MATTLLPLRTYRVTLEQEPDGSAWNVGVPALPGCFTFGRTVPALDRVQEAMAVYLESLAAHGEPIPPPAADGPAIPVQDPRRAGCPG